MDYFVIVNKAIEYIEKNIKEKITLEGAAEAVAISPFHFHRIFSVFTGFSFMEYIRKRKLYIAINELIKGKKSILETAVEFGYSTNESFSRAIQKEFGYNPSEIRKNGLEVDEFQKFKLWGIRYKKEYGDKKIPFEIIHTKNLKIAGVMRKFSLNDGENYEEIPKIKKELLEKREQIKNRINPEINRQIGVAFQGPLDLTNPFINEIKYFRGFEISENSEMPKEFGIREIAGFKCGKFYAGKTIKEHSDTLDYVYGIWLVENGFELGDSGVDFMEEVIEYDDKNKEIFFYIPIK